MAKCVNEKCKKDPLDSINPICINQDGDFACSYECELEYKKQMNEFFDNIGDDNWYNDWMGKIN